MHALIGVYIFFNRLKFIMWIPDKVSLQPWLGLGPNFNPRIAIVGKKKCLSIAEHHEYFQFFSYDFHFYLYLVGIFI